jgi:hypothetical protein
MRSRQVGRLLKLEQSRHFKVRCAVCGHARGDAGGSPPYVTVYGDPDSPENTALVDSRALSGCDVCGWEPRVPAVVIVVRYDDGGQVAGPGEL